MEQGITLIYGAAIALVTSTLTSLVSYFISRRQAKHDLDTKLKMENAQLRWEEIKKDIDAIEQLVEAINLRVTQMHNLAKLREAVEKHPPNSKPRSDLEKQEAVVHERLLAEEKQTQIIYARAVWRINSLPKDVRDAYTVFDQIISKNTIPDENARLTINLTEVNLAGGTLRAVLKEYLAIVREEITSS